MLLAKWKDHIDFIYVKLLLYIYIYIYVCVCVFTFGKFKKGCGLALSFG